MYIWVHLHDPAERARLCTALKIWRDISCVSAEIVTAEPADPAWVSLIFWDLDGPGQPPVLPGQNRTLFLCSRNPQRAIDSYIFHPAGFLTIPVSMEKLWDAMLRCMPIWFPSLLRLEVLSGRIQIGIPLRNLVWVESNRRGCLVHTSHQTIAAREPLYQLEQHLPQKVFARCQRSFLVNLAYVQEITGTHLLLNDGTALPLGRGIKTGVLEAYQRFRRLRYGK